MSKKVLMIKENVLDFICWLWYCSLNENLTNLKSALYSYTVCLIGLLCYGA